MSNPESNEWQLFYLSASLTRARKLEVGRESFHRELYAAIAYPSMRIDPFDTSGNNPNTDSQAIRIIEAKERYETMIQKEYSRFDDWTQFLQQFSDDEQTLLVRHFQKKKPVATHNFRRLLWKVDKRLQVYERATDKQRTIQAARTYGRYKASTEPFRSVLPPTKSYLIRGSFIKLSEDNYENYKRRTGKVADYII